MFNQLANSLIILGLCILKMILIFGSCSIVLVGLMSIIACITRDKAVNRKLYDRVIKDLE